MDVEPGSISLAFGSCEALPHTADHICDFVMPHEGYDHVPVAVRFFIPGSFMLQPRSKRHAAYDRTGWRDAEKVVVFKELLSSATFTRADVEASSHEFLVNDLCRDAAFIAFGPSPVEPRQAYVTRSTVASIKARGRSLRQFGNITKSIVSQSSGVRTCFKAWRSGRRPWTFHAVFVFLPFGFATDGAVHGSPM